MNLFVFIATGVVILAAPLYAAEVTDEMRQARAEAIAIARAQCAELLSSTPQKDKLYVIMNQCYKHNAHVFRPIEGVPGEVAPPYDPNRAPVFQPDPLGNTPLTRWLDGFP